MYHVFGKKSCEFVTGGDIFQSPAAAPVVHGYDHRRRHGLGDPLCGHRIDGVDPADGYHQDIYPAESGKLLFTELMSQIAAMCKTQPLSRNDELIIRGNAVVGEVRRDSQIGKFLTERNAEEISRYLSRSLQDGWIDEYMIQFWETCISVNYQITEEETREQVHTTHWFFGRDKDAYEMVFYKDMITDEESRDVLNAMDIVR